MNSSEQNHGSESLSRRKFFKMGAASAVTLSVLNLARANAQSAAAPEATTHGTMVDVPFEKRNPRIAFIGVGHRGTSLLDNLLAAGAQIVALCDVNPASRRSRRLIGRRRRPAQAAALHRWPLCL